MAAPSASTSNAASSVLAITFFKCKHLEEQKLIKNVSHSKQMDDLFQEHHSRDKTVTYTVKCKTDMSKSAESFEIEGRPTLKQLQTCQFYSIFIIKYILNRYISC